MEYFSGLVEASILQAWFAIYYSMLFLGGVVLQTWEQPGEPIIVCVNEVEDMLAAQRGEKPVRKHKVPRHLDSGHLWAHTVSEQQPENNRKFTQMTLLPSMDHIHAIPSTGRITCIDHQS